jgi:hypothetical protein
MMASTLTGRIGTTVRAAKDLDPTSSIKESDAKPYSVGVRIDDVWGQYARSFW